MWTSTGRGKHIITYAPPHSTYQGVVVEQPTQPSPERLISVQIGVTPFTKGEKKSYFDCKSNLHSSSQFPFSLFTGRRKPATSVKNVSPQTEKTRVQVPSRPQHCLVVQFKLLETIRLARRNLPTPAPIFPFPHFFVWRENESKAITDRGGNLCDVVNRLSIPHNL